jgi:hypothetical protein
MKDRTMTFREGFGVGMVVGAIATLLASGEIVTVSYTEMVRAFAFLILF